MLRVDLLVGGTVPRSEIIGKTMVQANKELAIIYMCLNEWQVKAPRMIFADVSTLARKS